MKNVQQLVQTLLNKRTDSTVKLSAYQTGFISKTWKQILKTRLAWCGVSLFPSVDLIKEWFWCWSWSRDCRMFSVRMFFYSLTACRNHTYSVLSLCDGYSEPETVFSAAPSQGNNSLLSEIEVPKQFLLLCNRWSESETVSSASPQPLSIYWKRQHCSRNGSLPPTPPHLYVPYKSAWDKIFISECPFPAKMQHGCWF